MEVKNICGIFAILLFISLIPFVIIMNGKKYPFSAEPRFISFCKKIAGKMRNIVNYFTFTGYEWYKNFIFQGGIFFFLFLLCWAKSGIKENNFHFYSIQESYLNEFYEETQGQTLEQAEQFCKKESEKITEAYESLERLLEDYQNGKIGYGEYQSQVIAYENIGQEEEALRIYEERLETLENYQANNAADCQIVNPNGYEALFGEESYEKNRLLAVKMLIFSILFFYLFFVYEKQTKASLIVRASKRGRMGFYLRKEGLVLLYSIGITLLFSLVELWNVSNEYGLFGFFSAAGNIELLQFTSGAITIFECFLFMLLARIIVLCCVGNLILLISVFAEKKEEALLWSAVCLLLPALLAVVGIKQFNYISFLMPLGVTELIGNAGKISVQAAGSYALCLLAGITGGIAALKHWENYGGRK